MKPPACFYRFSPPAAPGPSHPPAGRLSLGRPRLAAFSPRRGAPSRPLLQRRLLLSLPASVLRDSSFDSPRRLPFPSMPTAPTAYISRPAPADAPPPPLAAHAAFLTPASPPSPGISPGRPSPSPEFSGTSPVLGARAGFQIRIQRKSPPPAAPHPPPGAAVSPLHPRRRCSRAASAPGFAARASTPPPPRSSPGPPRSSPSGHAPPPRCSRAPRHSPLASRSLAARRAQMVAAAPASPRSPPRASLRPPLAFAGAPGRLAARLPVPPASAALAAVAFRRRVVRFLPSLPASPRVAGLASVVGLTRYRCRAARWGGDRVSVPPRAWFHA